MKQASFIVVLAVVLLGAVDAGCSGLAFVQQRQLLITTPAMEAAVDLPVTVTWTSARFAVTGPTATTHRGAGYFEVLVDVTPQPPGRGLGWFAHGDHTCRPAAGCPGPAYLAPRGVYLTTAKQYTITSLPLPNGASEAQFHTVTVVTIDGRGRRIGEGYAVIRFEVHQHPYTP
ncbi:MAG: hypothetical protein ACYDH6_03160 [Acidimicrobiales bacterium]